MQSPDGAGADGPAVDAAVDAGLHCQAAGELDPGFGNGGVAGPIFGFVPGQSAMATAVLVDAASRIVVSVGFLVGGARDCAIVRLLPGGALDPSFGAGGIGRAGIPNHQCYLADIAFQSTGKIVAAGRVVDPQGATRVVLMRFLDDGQLDTAFGSGGVVLTQAAPWSAGEAVAVDSADRIVVAAIGEEGTWVDAPAYVVTLRYLSDGALDSSFGTGGVAEAAFNSAYLAQDVAIQSNDRIVVSGHAFSWGKDMSVGLVRYAPAGTKDMSFGSTGLVTLPFSSGGLSSQLAVDSSGRVVVTGNGSDGGYAAGAIARIDDSGAMDSAFGMGGYLMQTFPPEHVHFAKTITTAGDQLVAVGNSVQAGTGTLRVARYSAAGVLDASFGAGGFAQPPAGLPWYMGVDLIEQSDARIVVVGGGAAQSAPLTGDLLIARYCP